MACTDKSADRCTKKSRRREQLILALLQHSTIDKAAAAIGISVSTAWRLRRTPEFHQEYLETRREAVFHGLERMQQGCGAAASTLLKIMLDPASPANSRVRAAATIIRHSQQLLEAEDFELRLQRLEQIAKVRGADASEQKQS